MTGEARRRRLVGLSLFAFLLSVYLLNFSGRPHSSDGIAMLATAESLVRRGDLDMNAYLWMGLQQGSFGPDGELYSRKGLGQVLASLPLAWLGLRLEAVGLVQTAMLLGPLVAAATALVLYATVLALGYGGGAALGVALLYGLATPALPYSKYCFSDPLTGLALAAAALALTPRPSSPAAPGEGGAAGVRAALACGLALGFAVLTRTTSLALAPLFGLALLAAAPPSLASAAGERAPARSRLAPLASLWQRGRRVRAIAFAAGLGALLLVSGAFNYRRYGDPLASGYLPQESFSGDWVAGVAGLLLSPGRGLLFYAPLFLLALPGWPLLRRRHPAIAWLVFGVFAAHVLIYGKWFMWHGGYVWGPRFLLPALPLLALALAPLWQRRRWRVALLAVGAVSLAPQVLGSLVHFGLFQDELLTTGLPLYAPETFWQPRYSPLLGQWRYLGAGLDFAWAQSAAGEPRLDAVSPAALLALVALAGWCLRRAALGRGRFLLPLTLAALPLVAGLVLVRAYGAGSLVVDAPLRLIEARERPGDALLLVRPDDSLTVSDRYKGRLPAYGLPDEPGAWLQRLGAEHERLWLLADDAPPEQSPVETALMGWGYRALTTTWPAAGRELGRRLALYARPGAELAVVAGGERFGDGIVLEEAALLARDGVLFVRLLWRAEAAPQRDYKVFVQAYDAGGMLLAQHDGMPALWQRPTSTWARGETVEDRHAVLLEAAAAYVLVGLYEAEGGARLPPASGGDGLRLALP